MDPMIVIDPMMMISHMVVINPIIFMDLNIRDSHKNPASCPHLVSHNLIYDIVSDISREAHWLQKYHS